MNALLASIKARGFVVNGQRLTVDFLGGLFSLDGIHPTYTGHAILANEFIKTLNSRLGTDIPPLAVRQVAVSDPLVLPQAGRPASGLGLVQSEAIAAMRRTLLRH